MQGRAYKKSIKTEKLRISVYRQMSARNTNFEFARQFLDARIRNTEADVAEEEEGERFTTWQNQVIEIVPQTYNGVLIFALLDVGARAQLRVNLRNRMSLPNGLLRLREFRVIQNPEFIRLQVTIRQRGVLANFLERLLSAIGIMEPEALQPPAAQDEVNVIE